MPSVGNTSNPPPSDDGPGIDARRVVARLAGMICLAVLLTAGITAAVIAAGGQRAWWGAWVAALIANSLAAAISLLPLLPGLSADAQLAAYGYLAGAVIRVLTVLAGGMVAVIIVRTPPVPTVLLLVPFYFAQLLAEAMVLCRAYWPARHDSRVG